MALWCLHDSDQCLEVTAAALQTSIFALFEGSPREYVYVSAR